MHLLSINLWLQGRNDEIWEVSFNPWDNCFRCVTILEALPDSSTSLSSSIYQSSSNRSIREMKWVVSNLVNYFLNLKIYFTNIVRNITKYFSKWKNHLYLSYNYVLVFFKSFNLFLYLLRLSINLLILF